MKQLGDILLDGGLVSAAQLTGAIEEHQRSGRSLGRVLVEQGVLSEGQLVAALATQIGLRFVDLTEFAVDGSAVTRIPDSVCRRYTALPIGYEDGKLLVARPFCANNIVKVHIDQQKINAFRGTFCRTWIVGSPDHKSVWNQPEEQLRCVKYEGLVSIDRGALVRVLVPTTRGVDGFPFELEVAMYRDTRRACFRFRDDR